MPRIVVRQREIYYQWPEGRNQRPVAVFLHDGLGSLRSWKDTPQRIARAAQVCPLVYDRYGYGRSQRRSRFPPDFLEREARFLKAFLKALEIDRVHLIGHSDGATIALLYAARHRKRTLSAVVEVPHSYLDQALTDGVQGLLQQVEEKGLPRWLVRQHGNRAEELLHRWAASWLDPGRQQWDIRPKLESIRCPVLVIQGDEDPFGSREQVEAVTSRVSASQSWLLPETGHVPHAEARDQFVDRVTGFLNRLGN